MDFEAYGLVLAIHSTLRWVAIGAGVVAAAAAWAGRLGSSSWADTTSGAGRAFAAMFRRANASAGCIRLGKRPAATPVYRSDARGIIVPHCDYGTADATGARTPCDLARTNLR